MRGWGLLLLFIGAVACSGAQGSIGAMFGKSHADGRLIVREVPPDMESAKAGLEPGDEVLLIDGQDVRHMDAKQIHEAFVGPVGSTVQLTVVRNERVIRLEVKRGVLK